MNLEEHVIKKEGKMKIISSLPSVFVDTRQSCHVIDPSLEMGLSHARSLSLPPSLSLLPLPFFLRLPCSLQISAAVGAWWRGWPRRHGTRGVRWAPSALGGEARATPRRAAEAMRVHGGLRRPARRGRLLRTDASCGGRAGGAWRATGR